MSGPERAGGTGEPKEATNDIWTGGNADGIIKKKRWILYVCHILSRIIAR